jgi:predicted transcriptional regulator
METFTTQDLIEELQNYLPTTPIRKEGEGITVQEWQDEQGIAEPTARRQLTRLVEQGVLTREKCKCADGEIRFVYYRKVG